MPRPKPIRPGDNCQDCGSLLFPHCPHKTWPRGCDWVKCRGCGAYGTAEHWVSKGVADDALRDDDLLPPPE